MLATTVSSWGLWSYSLGLYEDL